MSRRVMALAGVAILFAGAMAWANQGTPDDTKALDKTLEGWAAAFNSHDAKAIAATYTEDADAVLPTGERLKGRAAIEKGLAAYFAANPKVKTKLSVTSRRFIKPDVVVEDGEWEESEHTEKGLPTKGIFTTVLVKQHGAWLAVSDHGSTPVSRKP